MIINRIASPLKHLATFAVRIKILDLIHCSYYSAISVFLKVSEKFKMFYFLS